MTAFGSARRQFLRSLIIAALAGRFAPARGESRSIRIGILGIANSWPTDETQLAALREGLREYGWTEGENLAFEYRLSDPELRALPRLANDLVRAKVVLIVAPHTPAALAAKKATRTIFLLSSSLSPIRWRAGWSRVSRDPAAMLPACHPIMPCWARSAWNC